MKAKLKLKALALAAMTVVGASSALAQEAFVPSNSTVYIRGNTDSSANFSEGVYISSNDCTSLSCNSSSVPQSRATASFLTNGTASINGVNSVSITSAGIATLNASTVNVGGTANNLTIGNEGVSANTITGATNTINAINGNAINGATNAINGAINTITGTTTNNITGPTNTITGTTTNTITGPTNNITGTTTNNITGPTNNITGTTNNITGTTNNINGITRINSNRDAATFINTGESNAAVTIGNSDNTTHINSGFNNIGVNTFGTVVVKSINSIGNTNAATTVTATAGNASQSLANNTASTLVTGGASGLTARTGTANVATSAQVLLSNVGGTTVDANGKIITAGSTGYVAPTAPTAALTLTNGYGNTHGLVVTESQTTLSGGTQSSSLTMNDSGARFGNASTGAPVTVTGVADGRKDFDAVNVRQFANAVAAAAAQANVPALAAGQDRTLGLGVGNFMGKTALALGLHVRGDAKSTYRLSVSSGMSGGVKPIVGAGAAWSF